MDALSRPLFTPLRRIAHPQGDVLHAMKAGEAGFRAFGEAYFTSVHQGVTKGWKQHTRMQMNLVVPVGRVRFHLHDTGSGVTECFELGPDNYGRLTVPPGLWMAFSGMDAPLNLVLNLADLPHDPAEALNAPLERFPLEPA